MTRKTNKTGGLFTSIANWWQKLTQSGGKQQIQHKLHSKKVDHNVAPKQVILPTSPAKEEQLKFIDEGGNSQPLSK